MGIENVKELTDAQCREIAGMTETNHIWLNAMTMLKPTDEQLKAIGQAVVNMLNQKENLIPARADHDCSMAALTPMLYLRINQS